MNFLFVMAAACAVAVAGAEPEQKEPFSAQIKQVFRNKTTLMLEKQDVVSESKARLIGAFVAEKFKEKRVAVLVAGPADAPWNVNILKWFRDAVGINVITEVISVEMPEKALPVPDDEPGVEALNKSLLASIERRADVVVNFAGLPFRNSECKKLIFWKWAENDPRVILADLNDPLLLKRKFFPMPIAAAAVSVPERDEFIFITNDNADGIVKSRQLILSN